MTTFNMKTAKEVLTMVNEGKATRLDAMQYAIEKREALQAKGKTMRARLWDRTIKALQSMDDTVTRKPARNHMKYNIWITHKNLDENSSLYTHKVLEELEVDYNNPNLVIAAPDLLKACQASLDIINACKSQGFLKELPVDHIEYAIEKAKGGHEIR